MPKDYSRSSRIADQIQRELAELIHREVNDPRAAMVTITGAEVTRDLSYAKIFISTLDSRHSIEEVVDALNKASGFLHHLLRDRMTSHCVPRLTFYHDKSIEEGMKIDALLSGLDKDNG
ncbi:MAG: 30S ribosome-binding factor RbfA [Gammaproteobacteria bacterium]|nr:MAG: 30S ribosome-binding factor RbfA [Gammaproteobacteria bacterium]